jgi:hypothetical protein
LSTTTVRAEVIQRIHRLKGLSVKIGGGRGKYQTFKLVKSDAPDALVFQSIHHAATKPVGIIPNRLAFNNTTDFSARSSPVR